VPLKLLLRQSRTHLLQAEPYHRLYSILVILIRVSKVRNSLLTMTAVQDEGLKNLMMSWYYAGYYTGLLEGQQKAFASMQEGG
jgi:hypothetical protein